MLWIVTSSTSIPPCVILFREFGLKAYGLTTTVGLRIHFRDQAHMGYRKTYAAYALTAPSRPSCGCPDPLKDLKIAYCFPPKVSKVIP